MLHSTLHRVLIFTYKKFKYYVIILYTNINTIMPPAITYLLSPPTSPSPSSSSPSSTKYITSSRLPSYDNNIHDVHEGEEDDWENLDNDDDIDYYECDEIRSKSSKGEKRRSREERSAVRYVKAIQKVAQRYGGGYMCGTERRLMERLVREKKRG